MVTSGQLHGPAALSAGKDQGTQCTGRGGGGQGQSGRL